MIQTSRTLIESADGVYSKLTQAQRAGNVAQNTHSHISSEMNSASTSPVDHLNTVSQLGIINDRKQNLTHRFLLC